MSTVAEEWFGAEFASLHPVLQNLHRRGGILAGEVVVAFGSGLAGVVGRRIAKRLGVPSVAGPHRLCVEIRNREGALHWARRFDSNGEFLSKFVPVGRYPSGYWVEHSGLLRLNLGVKVDRGGWQWEHRATKLLGVRIPNMMLPRTLASKEVLQDASYRFSVQVRAPVFGMLFGYSGKLTSHAE